MKEINIGKTITVLRKEKGISQDVLADFLGVSKAAVSKWETGQSYPDITLLPKISTYFNTTVDTLLDYKPQMTKEEIRVLYEGFTERFTKEPFDKVYEDTQAVIKEYYSCYQLILQIGALYLNYSNIADADIKDKVISEANKQFIRVKNESNDVDLVKQAQSLEVTSLLMLNKPNEIIELLGDSIPMLISSETLRASAYMMVGKPEKAKYVTQVASYQYLLALTEQLIAYLSFCTDDIEVFTEVYNRVSNLAESFHLEKLHPTMLMNVQLVAAQCWLGFGEEEQALDILEQYTNLVLSDIYPLTLHGDEFFNMLNTWVDEIGYPFPRDQRSVRLSMIDGIEKNPAFAGLEHNNRFQTLLARLKKSM